MEYKILQIVKSDSETRVQIEIENIDRNFIQSITEI